MCVFFVCATFISLPEENSRIEPRIRLPCAFQSSTYEQLELIDPSVSLRCVDTRTRRLSHRPNMGKIEDTYAKGRTLVR